MTIIKCEAYKLRYLLYPYLAYHSGTYYIYKLHRLFNDDPELIVIKLSSLKSDICYLIALHLKLLQKTKYAHQFCHTQSQHLALSGYASLCQQSITHYKDLYRLLSAINHPDWEHDFADCIRTKIAKLNQLKLLFYHPNKFTQFILILSYLVLAILAPVYCELQNGGYMLTMITALLTYTGLYFFTRFLTFLGKVIFNIPTTKKRKTEVLKHELNNSS